MTERLPVIGGWLYRYYGPDACMCFVPDYRRNPTLEAPRPQYSSQPALSHWGMPEED